jgi:hypothetical protein
MMLSTPVWLNDIPSNLVDKHSKLIGRLVKSRLYRNDFRNVSVTFIVYAELYEFTSRGDGTNMYGIVIFLHVVGVFVFLIAHGASNAVAFALRRERNTERVRALLELSPSTFGMMYGGLLLILLTGIAGGFLLNWWAQGWIWASLVLLILLVVGMAVYVAPYYGNLRRAAGLPYMLRGKPQPAESAVSDAELARMLESPHAMYTALMGWVGLLVILALMMFKPF